MTSAISRRQFLRFDYTGSKVHSVRPPWALPETEFQRRCTTCEACVKACPESIIKSGGGKYPEIDFSEAACTFCGDCLSACSDGALIRNPDTPPWSLKASIDPSCLSQLGITCRACADNCETEAIKFLPGTQGTTEIKLDNSQCNGCGACLPVCPVNAVSFNYTNLKADHNVSH